MFEITQLKEKKLSELQEIAKELKISRYRSLKKLDLIYQILDVQAASPVEKKPQEQKNQPKEESRTDQKNNTKANQKPENTKDDKNSGREIRQKQNTNNRNNHHKNKICKTIAFSSSGSMH